MAKSYANNIWFFFFREYPRQTIVMVFLLVCAGLAESLGAVSLVPLLGNLFGQEAHSSPILQRVGEVFVWFGVEPSLKNILMFLCVAMVTKATLTMLAFRIAGNVEAEVSTKMRIRLLNGLLCARWSYYISCPSGGLVNALSTECSQAGVALRVFGNMLSFSIQAFAYMVAGLMVSWHLLIAGLLGGVGFFWVFRKLVAFVRKAGKKQIAALNEMSALFSDVLAGAKPLKVMSSEGRVLEYLKSQVYIFQVAVRQHVLGTSLMASLNEPVIVILMGLSIYVASVQLHMDAVSLLTVAFFFQRILSRISSAQQSWQQCAALEGVLLSLRVKIDEIVSNQEQFGGGLEAKLGHSVDLANVFFSYGDKVVLEDVAFRIPVGKITALVGPSGSGKTTVTDLIAGLSQPDSGRVLVDGVPLDTLDMTAWRKKIGYVPQEVFLFNDTVRSNVSLGRGCSDEAIWEALGKAGAKGFVESLEGKLDAVVGEQGRAISGGQRQRLMIARALVANPSLLILDEATTGLDETTEEEILANLFDMKEDIAILVISHQGAVRAVADQTVVLNSGTVA